MEETGLAGLPIFLRLRFSLPDKMEFSYNYTFCTELTNSSELAIIFGVETLENGWNRISSKRTDCGEQKFKSICESSCVGFLCDLFIGKEETYACREVTETIKLGMGSVALHYNGLASEVSVT